MRLPAGRSQRDQALGVLKVCAGVRVRQALCQSGPALGYLLGLVCGGSAIVCCSRADAALRDLVCMHACFRPPSQPVDGTFACTLPCAYEGQCSGHSSNALHSGELWPSEHSALVDADRLHWWVIYTGHP